MPIAGLGSTRIWRSIAYLRPCCRQLIGDNNLWYSSLRLAKVHALQNGDDLAMAVSAALSEGDGTLPDGEIWPDAVFEIEPTGPTSGDIVWEWHAWDHLIQDYNQTKDNYGVLSEHPELIDINYGGSTDPIDRFHANALDYRPI